MKLKTSRINANSSSKIYYFVVFKQLRFFVTLNINIKINEYDIIINLKLSKKKKNEHKSIKLIYFYIFLSIFHSLILFHSPRPERGMNENNLFYYVIFDHRV